MQGKILLYGYNIYVILGFSYTTYIYMHKYRYLKCVCLFITYIVYIHPIYISHQQLHPLHFTCIFIYSYFWLSFIHQFFPLSTFKTFTCSLKQSRKFPVFSHSFLQHILALLEPEVVFLPAATAPFLSPL